MFNRDSVKTDVPRTSNIQERYFDSQSYLSQNPYESTLPGNYYPYPGGYEM